MYMNKVLLQRVFIFSMLMLLPFIGVQAVSFNVDKNGDTVDVTPTDETKDNWKKKKEEVKEDVEEKKEEIEQKVQEKQCDIVKNRREVTMNRMENRLSSMEVRVDSKSDRVENRQVQNDTRIENAREEARQARENVYGELEEAAITSSQKEAVAEFKNSNEIAVTKKQITLDEAREQYRDDMEEIMSDWDEEALDPYKQYISAMESAMDSAISRCDSGEVFSLSELIFALI